MPIPLPQVFPAALSYSFRALVADVVGLDPATETVKEIHQVGRLTRSYRPVSREMRALRDIVRSNDYNGAPIYYHGYNRWR
jgi:hypothetical protein